MKSYINLFDALISEAPKVKNRIPFMFCLLAIASIVSVGSIGFALLEEKNAQNIIDSLNYTLNAPSVKELVAQDDKLKGEIVSNQKDLVLLEELDNYITSQKGFETQMYHTINAAKPQAVTIQAISYSAFQMTVSCESAIGNDPADFAKALEATKVFTDVSYKGFVEIKDEKTISFTLICTLPDSAKEAANESSAE